ncbi:PRC-barrel domain-containing protein [uncultured Tateyamaria sp.]|uniref:PRC-barrel domain-containing protein n=1 Tax=uncultured Tateyamaria sp. TaxID=455651 RepID=UPI002618624D|nr:PRC-barrel domain-containing protein [uncultured Tateyamaria sp.]
MKRIFASVLALTVATPLIAGDTAKATKNDTAYGDSPIVMDENWKSDDLATFDAPQIERDGWVIAPATELTTEELTGMRVYDANDEWIGEIDSVIVSTDGTIQGAVLGVGGFLAIGEKDVLVSFDSLTIKQEAEGDDMRVYAAMTESQLEALPAYES